MLAHDLEDSVIRGLLLDSGKRRCFRFTCFGALGLRLADGNHALLFLTLAESLHVAF